MKKIIKLVLFLAIVSGISGGMLAFVNNLTAPIIESLGMEKEKATLEIMFPGTEYSPLEYEDESGLIKGVYEAAGQGTAFKLELTGFSNNAPIVAMVGLDNDGAICSFVVVSHGETSGIGSRITTDEYLDIILGATDGNVDTLAGATVSSTAVKGGIKAVFDVYPSVKGGN